MLLLSSDSQGNNKEAYLHRKNITSAPVARYVLSHTSSKRVQSETAKGRKSRREREGGSEEGARGSVRVEEKERGREEERRTERG